MLGSTLTGDGVVQAGGTCDESLVSFTWVVV
jgi:hypothetical protein